EIADDVVGVGAAGRRACEPARGEILAELDHDDLPAKDCLAELGTAFDAHPEAVFVHSDTAQITEDAERDDSRFNGGANLMKRR
ncbi:glycosyltransferase, partial [Streptomyces sp. NPDC002920]